MPSSEQKWNIWQTVKRLMHVPLSTVERDELQRHGDGGRHSTNNQSRHRVGRDGGSRTRVNQRRDTDAKEVCELKARSAVQERKIERLEGKVAEQSQLLQETSAKLTSVDHAAKQQTQDIGRLEKKVAKLDRDQQEKTAPLHSIVDRGARKANRIKGPEANAPEFSQVPQDKIEKLLSADPESRQNSPLQKKPFSSEDAASKRDQKVHDSSATSQKLYYATESKRTNKPLPRTPVSRADSISVADVAELVRVLNADLEQTSCRIVNSLSDGQSPISGRGSEVVSNELRDYLGLWLCRDLHRRSSEPDAELDPLITQIALQTGLANACSCIINGWTPPDTCQGVADTWRAPARSYTSAKSNNQDVKEKYLTSILHELINAVVGSLPSGDQLPPMHQEDIEGIASKAVALHRIINEEVPTPLKLVTYTIPCDTEFDSSRMEDTEGNGGETGSTPRVICTIGMGLQDRGKIEPGKSRQEYDVTIKAKVVLAGTLDAQGS